MTYRMNEPFRMPDSYYEQPEPDFPDGCLECNGDVEGDRWDAKCVEPQYNHAHEPGCNCDEQEDPQLGCGWEFHAPSDLDPEDTHKG